MSPLHKCIPAMLTLLRGTSIPVLTNDVGMKATGGLAVTFPLAGNETVLVQDGLRLSG